VGTWAGGDVRGTGGDPGAPVCVRSLELVRLATRRAFPCGAEHLMENGGVTWLRDTASRKELKAIFSRDPR
jgi:hypothetical protein